MKNRLFSQSIEQRRAGIRARLDRYRLSREPLCHIALPDDDYQAMLGESLAAYPFERKFTELELLASVDRPAYELFHGIKLVSFSARPDHVATECTRAGAGR